MKYTVIIPTHNEGSELASTVLSILASIECCEPHARSLEVVIVNDQCTDGSIELLLDVLDQDMPVEVLSANRRLGCTGAKRLGADFARGDMLVFLDSHSRAGDRWLHHLEDGIDEIGDLDAGLFGPTMYSLGGTPDAYEQGGYWPTHHMERAHMPRIDWDLTGMQRNARVLYVCGNGQAISRAVYEDVGGFDAGMWAPWGAEDEELCLRLWRYGYECWILRDWKMESLYKTDGFQYKVDYVVPLHNTLRLAYMHFDADRYHNVVKGKFEQLQQATSGAAFAEHSDYDRYKYLLDALLHVNANETTWQDKIRHAARAKRSVSDIFEQFGMRW